MGGRRILLSVSSQGLLICCGLAFRRVRLVPVSVGCCWSAGFSLP